MSLLSSRQQQSGSVVLVALCFLAVLGISLASYLAVCHQAVKLSNREYQRSISLQLAESGIEQSLWSFGWNNWSSSDLATIPGSAIRHISFPTTKYNNGVAGSIMLRVDRYDATIWNNFTSYNSSTQHDIVWYQGVWYQCVVNTSGTAPPIDGPLWSSAPGPWNASANYRPNNIVLYSDGAYTCVSGNINTPPTTANIPSYWTTLSPTIGNWNGATNYAINNVVLFGGMSYRCIVANSNNAPPDPNYWVGSPTIYSEGIATSPDNPAGAIRTQLRAFIAPAPLFPNAIAATSTISLTTGIVDSYNSALGTYPPSITDLPTRGYSATIAGGNTLGSAVKVSGGTIQGYISVPSTALAPYPANANLAGTLIGPTGGSGIDPKRITRNPDIPIFDPAKWDANKGYRVNDFVSYASDLYLCKLAPTAHQMPTDMTFWVRNQALFLPPSGNIDIGTAAATVPSIYYISSGTGAIDLDAGDTITIKGPVILNVPDYLRTKNGGKIIINSTGSAQIVVANRLRIDGTGGIENKTSDPKKLIIIDTSTSVAFGHRFSAAIPFYGEIYLPTTTSTLTFSNMSGSDPKIFGAVTAKNIMFSPAVANFHYDTCLRTVTFPGIDSPFTVTEWRELTDPAEKILLP